MCATEFAVDHKLFLFPMGRKGGITMGRTRKATGPPRCIHGMLLGQCAHLCERTFEQGVAYLERLFATPPSPEELGRLVRDSAAKLKKGHGANSEIRRTTTSP